MKTPIFIGSKKIFRMARRLHYNYGMESGRKKSKKHLDNSRFDGILPIYKTDLYLLENRKMEIEIIYTSDCCTAYLSDAHVEHGLCPECGDNCEVNKEEILVTPVCGG